MSATVVASTTLFCGFCGKSHHQVRKMIAGPATKPGNATNICDECVELCALILAEDGMLRLPPALDHQVRAIARAEIEEHGDRMSAALRSALSDVGDRVSDLPPLTEGLS